MDMPWSTAKTPRPETPNGAPAVTCATCHLQGICLPQGLPAEEMTRLEALIHHRRRVRRGEALYTTHTPFEAIYAIRCGFFKTTITVEDGRDQVTGFQMVGELIGLDGIGTELHTCNAIALEDSDVCTLPFASLETLFREIPQLQRHFHRLMSREITRDHSVMLLLGTMRAEERLAAFLVGLSQRSVDRGFCAAEFVLRMTRDEIGSYLGLKLETVSRAFSKFQDAGLIQVQQKRIRLIDIDGMKALIGGASRP